jgi:peptidoglycan hydrolase-like protein with peptidoglycan-binding domain
VKPKLQYGSHGNSVSEAQAKLNALLPASTPPLRVDGAYGSKTVQRVQELQRTRGLVADGIVGAKTWAVLDGTRPPKPTGLPPTGAPNPTLAATRVRVGAKTVCSCGSQTGKLVFSAAGGRVIANVRDTYAGMFGKCHSLHNPKVQLQTQLKDGVFTPQPCTPALQGFWTAGAPIELVGTPPAAALGMNSVIVCAFGGVVSIVDKGK